MSGRSLAILVSGFLIFSATSCKKSQLTPADLAAQQKILLLGNGSEPKNLDPHLVTGVPENNVIQSILEGLIAYHPTDDTEPEPGVAESWEANEDSSKWTFFLRKDAKWTNGEIVTAHDFVYSFRRMLTPALGARYADMLYVIQNAEAYHKGELTDFDQVAARALDDHTLEIHLIGPMPYFLSMLKHYSWYPVNPRVIEAFGGIENRDSDWTQVANFVGNGAFRLKVWNTNSVIEVEKNPTYWDYENVKPNGIRFFPIERASTEESAFRAGQIHYCYNIPLDRIEFYKSQHPEKIRLDPYLGSYFYRVNVTKPPLDNVFVRKALSLAIDRSIITKHITRGNEIAATGYVYDGMKGYKSPATVHFDPIKAKEYLASAGFPNGKGFPQMDILINTDEAHKVIAEAIQTMWREHLNIDIGIINQEWKVYLDSQIQLNYEICRAGWIGDYMDPITFLMIFTSGSGNNNTGWANENYDRLFEELVKNGNMEERLEIMNRMEQELLDELPVIPIYWYTRKFLLHESIKDWHPKLLDNRPYKYIDFETE